MDGTKLRGINGASFVYEEDFVSANPVWIAAARNGNTAIAAAINVYRFTIKDAIHAQDGNLAMRDYIPVVTADGTPVLYDLVTRRGCPNAGSGNFSIGVEGKDQLFTLLDNVPSTTEGLRIIVPMEEQLWLSESVLTTIKTACENGWDIVKASNESDPYLVTALRELIAAQVGEGNYSVTFTYDNKTCVIALASSITLEQCEEMFALARQILPSTFTIVCDYVPTDYTQIDYLESTGNQLIALPLYILNEVDKWKNYGIKTDGQLPNDETYKFYCGAVMTNGRVGLAPFCGNNARNMRFYCGKVYAISDNTLRKVRSCSEINWQKSGTYKIYNDTYKLEGEIDTEYVNTYTLQQAFYIFGANTIERPSAARVWSVAISEGESIIYDLLPAVDPQGEPCMFNTITRTPHYKNVASMSDIVAGIKTKEQLLNIVSKLPVTTEDTLVVSLPITLLPDDDVNNAFISALDKGWIIVVHEWIEDENAVATGYTPIAYLENRASGQGIYTSITSIDQKTVEIKAKPKSMQNSIFGQYPYVDGTRYYATMGWESALGKHLINARSSNRLVQYWQADIEFFRGSPRVYRFNTIDNTLTVDDIEGDITSYAHTNKFNDLPFALMGLTHVNTDLTYYMSSSVGVRCYYCKLSASDGTLEANYIACLDNEGIPCMYDTVGKQVYYNAGDGSFLVGFENDIQLVTALSRLPIASSEQTLNVSVPEEVLASESVQQLIQYYAEEKNWTLIIS